MKAECVIFTDVELHLALHLLGQDDWADFPVRQDGHPLEQRLSHGLLRLIRRGMAERTSSGFRATETLRHALSPILEAKTTLFAHYSAKPSRFFYISGSDARMMEQVATEMNSCRLTPVSAESVPELLLERVEMPAVIPDASAPLPMDPIPRQLPPEALTERSALLLLIRREDGNSILRIWEESGVLWLACRGKTELTTPFSTDAFTRLWKELNP